MSAPMSAAMSISLLVMIGLCSVWVDVTEQMTDDEFEGGSRALVLEHSFDSGLNPTFSKKGTVILKSLKGNRAFFSQSAPLTIDEQTKLKELARNNDIYRLRLQTGSGSSSGEYVTTYTPACGILSSNLSDHIWIHFDQSGEVMGISVETTSSLCTPVDSFSLRDWNTSMEVSQTVLGPMPDTQSYIEKLKREEQERSKGQTEDKRSFLAKYWMYIVPIVLVMMLSGAGDQQGQGGGGGGGGGGQ
ncbi:ER membrane protein complex subunit 10-like isoform X2 [Ostrea edulis]|uniref:ER membrane protein complex subunit 10-like isoform X2 n=1 Tax=Ostrea edulis TaxID=37623 RepID=UPI0020964257|nr:ER membrane protein complex subunit 10-like isoform X2 [Ostrea edulis]